MLLSALLVIVSTFTSPATPLLDRKGADGVTSMPEQLAEIAANADPKANRFLNLQRAELFRLQARRTKNANQRFQLLHRGADEWVKAGKPAEGAKQLEELLAVLTAPNAPALPNLERGIRYSLALAYLRLGEQENCVHHHQVDSCIFPIRGRGVHTFPKGSTQALEQLVWLLERYPQRRDYRWLANLAAMTLGRYPDAVPEAHRIPRTNFESGGEGSKTTQRHVDVAGKVGLATVGLAGGACVDDFTGDGLLDVFVTSWGLTDPSRFFVNRGDGHFEDATSAWGLDGVTGGLNTSHADYDGDGDLDVLILRGAWLGASGEHPNSLLRNDGNRFTDVTEEAGLLTFHPTQVGEWADFDRDGDLDLFIGNESGPDKPRPCQLFLNDGSGRFRDVAADVGLAHIGYIKGASWGDVDNDGDPDLYLSALGTANALYENLGPTEESPLGRFREVGAAAGVTEPLMSFATWFWDYDNDGHEDILVCSYGSFTTSMLEVVARDYLGDPHDAESFRLFRNLGNGRFEDRTVAAGLDCASMPMGANFGDLDGDGFLDAYFGTGQPSLGTLIPNRMFRNMSGRTFEDVTTAGGFGHLQKGHGIAFADLDHDGDQDVFATMGGAYEGDVYMNALFENPGYGNRWITLILNGTASNADAIGARLEVSVREADGSTRSIHRTVNTGGSFGCSTLRQEIGLGRADRIESVTVRWPLGDTTTFTGLELDRAYRLTEGTAEATPITLPRFVLGDTARSKPTSQPKNR